jgi:hypothetical protein
MIRQFVVAAALAANAAPVVAQTVSERRFLVTFSAAHLVTTTCPNHDAYEVNFKGFIRQGDLMGVDAVAILQAWDEARHAILRLPYDRSKLIPWVSKSVAPYMADVMADKNVCIKWPELLLKTDLIREKAD